MALKSTTSPLVEFFNICWENVTFSLNSNLIMCELRCIPFVICYQKHLGELPRESTVVRKHNETLHYCPRHLHSAPTIQKWKHQERRGSSSTASVPVFLLTQMAYLRPFSCLCVWRRETNRCPCRTSVTNRSILPGTAWRDSSGWRHNRTSAQHLAQDLVQLNSELKILLIRRTGKVFWQNCKQTFSGFDIAPTILEQTE